jgi:chromosomal replication initiator protein
MEQNPTLLWDECLRRIQASITKEQYDTLFAHATLVKHEKVAREYQVPTTSDGETQLKKKVAMETHITVRVPSQYIINCIEDRFVKLLHSILTAVFGKGVKLMWLAADMNNNTIEVPASSHTVSLQDRPGLTTAPKDPIAEARPKVNQLDSHLIPEKDFENFVPGASNKLPLAISESIADQPNKNSFNPLFIYGESGVGKTHLVNAIGHRIKERHPRKNVLYISTHLFQLQFTSATQRNKINDFIYFYQQIDILIVDDIQELESLDKTQDAFFHIFNHLIQNNKKIILTSDRPPVELKNLKDRLLTRFKGGMLAEIERPDATLRRDILNNKIQHNGLKIPENVVEFVAENVSENVRELEGVVNSLMAYSVTCNREVDLGLAEIVVKRVTHIEKKVITIEEILKRVCDYYSVKQDDIYTKSRKRNIVQVRQVSMYLAQKHTSLSCSRIGMLVGKRDHATVIHSVNQIEDRLTNDKKLKEDLLNIEELLLKKA